MGGAQTGETFQQFSDLFFTAHAALVFFAQHKGRFRQVGHDHIGLAAQLPHPLAETVIKAHIIFAVIPQNRVHQFQHPLFVKHIKDLFHKFDLPERAQIPCGNTVKLKGMILPVFADGVDLICQIMEGEGFEPGMHRQHRCGQDSRFDPGGGNNRQSHRQRTFPQT